MTWKPARKESLTMTRTCETEGMCLTENTEAEYFPIFAREAEIRAQGHGRVHVHKIANDRHRRWLRNRCGHLDMRVC
jgi:hypothetical protein